VACRARSLRHELAGPMVDCNFDAADNACDGEEHAREVAQQRTGMANAHLAFFLHTSDTDPILLAIRQSAEHRTAPRSRRIAVSAASARENVGDEIDKQPETKAGTNENP